MPVPNAQQLGMMLTVPMCQALACQESLSLDGGPWEFLRRVCLAGARVSGLAENQTSGFVTNERQVWSIRERLCTPGCQENSLARMSRAQASPIAGYTRRAHREPLSPSLGALRPLSIAPLAPNAPKGIPCEDTDK